MTNDLSLLQEEAAEDLTEALDLVAYAWGLEDGFKERVVNFVDNIINLEIKERDEN